MDYAGDETYKFTDFLPNYTFSTDVVLNGRAACYFDLYGGTVHSREVPGGAMQTFVDITTDGPPELLVTPMPPVAVRLCRRKSNAPARALQGMADMLRQPSPRKLTLPDEVTPSVLRSAVSVATV